MKLNRFSRTNGRRSRHTLIKSATQARPAVEPLEDRQMLSLTVDYRVFGSSTPKVATVTSVGQVVYLQEWVTITGTQAGSNDGLFSVVGSAISTKTSSTESVNGNLTDQLTPNFAANGSQQGTPTDLNGDGNLDVGSNNDKDIAGFINARAGGVQKTGGTVSGDSNSFVVATLVYTVTNLSYGQATDINFKYRNGVPSGAFDAVWWEDGHGENDQIGSIGVGAPVVITDPNLSPPVNGTISGTVYKTVNGSTSAFSGQTVYLDLGDTGSLVSGDPIAVTGSSGTYSFTDVGTGTYYLREVVPSGYKQTSPASSPTTITVKAGATNFTGKNFTDTATSTANTGAISGTVSKVVSGVTSPFSGVTVYLDTNNNGSLDSGETSITTSSSGTYSFGSLAAGTYHIREVVPSGYSQTSPSSSPTTVTLSTNSSSVSGENFTDTAANVTTKGSLLKGTVIGTAGSWANGGTTIAKAFDGNLSTDFVGPTANGDWAGLNLGSNYVITQVNYSPQPGFTARMVGGIFQGSSSPTFASGNVTLATITSNPTAGVYSTLTVSNTGSYQYVRYLGPNGSYGDVAEIQFYGTPGTTVTHTKLTGTVIGTSGSWSNSGSTISKAFDGNLSTYFDGPVANGDWAGLDLGSAKSVTQISYAPRSGWASRMVGGIFQASNSANFSSGVVNLYTITSTPATGSLTTVSVSVSGTYRYVRYLGPNGSYGDVSEINFYS